MRRIFLFITLLISIASIAILVAVSLRPARMPLKFGSFELGKELPFNFRPGASTGWAPPYEKIPRSKFYVFIDRDNSCIWESCGLDGAVVQTLGGYLAGESLGQPTVARESEFDDASIRKKYKSVMIIGDQNAKIVGIYPNRDMKDVLDFLRLYPHFVDFDLLNGVDVFGPLKVGQLTPRRPTGAASKGKKFYVYVFNKDIMDKGPCVSVACLGPGYFDYADEFGGWLASDGKLETAKVFGLDTVKLVRGEISLVVVADKNARIVAIHPGKTAFDILAILRQLPELADLSRF